MTPPTQQLTPEQARIIKRCIRQLTHLLPKDSKFVLLASFPEDRGTEEEMPVRLATNIPSTKKVAVILGEACAFALSKEEFQIKLETSLTEEN